MSTMNISLPSELKQFVDLRLQTEAYSSSSEYVRALIRQDRDREDMRAFMLKGLQSPSVGAFDDTYLDGLKQRVLDKQAALKQHLASLEPMA
jgi:antitoxin ParD1/3/4